MSRIQVLAGDWARHTSAVLLKSGSSRILRLRPPLGAIQDIDLVHRAPPRLPKPQRLIRFAARLRDSRKLLGATDRETYALIESATTG